VSEKRPFGFQQTEAQSQGELQAAEQLSMQSATPVAPACPPGYRLDRFIGAGTFGQVWLAFSSNTGRPVAIKFYLHRGGVNWSLLSREVKNLVQLSADRSVVQVLDVGWDADPPYYVMEYLPSGSLEELLQTRGRMSVPDAVEMFRKICVGLNHCHGKGILHCDLKPANILLDEDLDPRLADFGQSRMSSDQTPSLGTLFYMAPEQAMLDATPDATWDVYALGVILYRMLTGKVPHRNQPLMDKIDTAGTLGKRLQHYRDAILHDDIPLEHRNRRQVDRPLAEIVDQCLAPDPALRFANVQQVIAALDKRRESQTRRPLMLLGIVGPLILLAFTGVIGAQTINGASRSATEALRTEARGSNRLAAQFAARTLENELLQYFDVVKREAASTTIRKYVASLLQSDQVSVLRDKIVTTPRMAPAAEKTHLEFLHHPETLPLNEWLSQRLMLYQGGDNSFRPSVTTLFVTDTEGTIIACAYDDVILDSQNSKGRNFAYRTYFHGGENDLPPDTPIASIDPLTQTSLSASFPSTATGLWKVAFSSPIYAGPPTEDDQPREIVGLFVATTNLGDFELLRADEQTDQLAVVVDTRSGPLRGTVLQHPMMATRRELGDTMAGERYQVPGDVLDQLIAGNDLNYRDPVASSDGKSKYSGSWLAAVAPVRLPVVEDVNETIEEPKTVNTDMLVLVQYRLSKVFEPVGRMKQQLLFQGALAMLSIVVVTFAMWYFVNRVTNGAKTDDSQDDNTLPSHAQTMEIK